MLPAFCFLLKTVFFSVYNSKRRKQIKWGIWSTSKWFFFDLKSKYKQTTKNFNHSYLLILKQQTWKCKRKRILCQFWNALAMSIFETLCPNLEVLLSIFCAFVAPVLINFWNAGGGGGGGGLHPSPPPFRSTPSPPLCLTHPLILKFLQPPHYSTFWRLHATVCNREGPNYDN